MDERDETALRARTRLGVDEPEARLPKSGHLLPDVRRGEGEVMKTLAPALNEPRDHAIRLEGLEELDPNGPRSKERHADALRRYLFREVRLEPEAPIGLERLPETFHRDTDVVGWPNHTSCLGL